MNRKPINHPIEEPISKERLRLWLKLLKTSSMIEDEIRRRLRKEYDWTLPRFDVMSALYRSPDGLKGSEISKLLRVSNGNITGIVDKLAEEGLALRVAFPGDRRVSIVHLTPKGRDVFAKHAAAHEAWIDEILSGLDIENIEALGGLLDGLGHSLEKQEGE